jgi:hypothetical protein
MSWLPNTPGIYRSIDELPATVAILHQGVNLAGQQVITASRRCRLQLQPAPALVRGAFTRPLVDPLPHPLGRPASTFGVSSRPTNYS